MELNTAKRAIFYLNAEPCILCLGGYGEYLSVIRYVEQLGFDTAESVGEIFSAYGERILQIRGAHPEAARIEYFLDLCSDDIYIGLFRRLYGDELDELKFEPLSFYQLSYYRWASGERLTSEQLVQFRESMTRLMKTQLRGDPYYSFTELLPFKLVRLGDIRGLSLPFEVEYLCSSNPTEEICLRLSKSADERTEDYFMEELQALYAAFLQAEKALK